MSRSNGNSRYGYSLVSIVKVAAQIRLICKDSFGKELRILNLLDSLRNFTVAVLQPSPAKCAHNRLKHSIYALHQSAQNGDRHLPFVKQQLVAMVATRHTHHQMS